MEKKGFSVVQITKIAKKSEVEIIENKRSN